MSKSDAQRAMREANYARSMAGRPSQPKAATTAEPPSAPAAKKASTRRAKAADADFEAPAAQQGRCGHKSMNNRACTREAGHPEKSHRYS